MNKTVSIILCTFNEVNHIEKSLDLINKNLSWIDVNAEIVHTGDKYTEKKNVLKEVTCVFLEKK